jgi:glycosyltransferase involved in cell wall biosynthesis
MALIEERIILSISIPTFNRASFLKRCVDSIFVTNNGNALPIEVSIYNNASTDNTDTVIQNFLSAGYNINYSKNAETIDGNENIYCCYIKARGKYILTLGDDDYFIESVLDKLVEFLTKNNIGCLSLKYGSTHDPYCTLENKSSLKITQFDKQLEFIKKVHYNITFISANIIINPQLPEELSPTNNFLNFTQVPVILKAIYSGRPNFYCRTITLAAEPNNFVGYNILNVFLKNLNKVILMADIDSNEKVKIIKVINDELIISFFPHWSYKIFRHSDTIDKKEIQAIFARFYKGNFYYALYVKSIIASPTPVAKIILYLNKVHLKFRKLSSGN